jgi:two-component system response regulator RegA
MSEQRRCNVLVVDDDDAYCGDIARALANRRFFITSAATISAALAQADRNPPDFVLLELKIAGESGLKLVASLHKRHPDARIVVLTGYGSIATAIEAIKLGAVYYLCKPATGDEIVAAFHHEAGNPALPPTIRPMSLTRMEWEQLTRVLRAHNDNISGAARALSMHRRTLQRKLAKHPVRR